MSATNLDMDQVELARIEDPNVRRALRELQQHITGVLHRQQLEIDAILEMMQEKNVGSLADFRRHLMKLKTNATRGDRIHQMVTMAMEEQAGQRPTA